MRLCLFVCDDVFECDVCLCVMMTCLCVMVCFLGVVFWQKAG